MEENTDITCVKGGGSGDGKHVLVVQHNLDTFKGASFTDMDEDNN